VGTHAPEEGVGEGARVTTQLRHPPAHQALVTGTTEETVLREIVPGPIYVRDVANHIQSHNVQIINDRQVHGNTDMIVNDTSLSNIAKPKWCCDNRQVETEQDGWSKGKATWLCACTPQHHMHSIAAPSGECAEPASLTSEWGGHKLTTTQHTQHPTTTGISTGTKLANSPITITKLKVKLMEYAQVNKSQANEYMHGFSNGFSLGYMGPRVLKKSKNLISVAQNKAELEIYSKIKGEIEKGRVRGPFEVPPFDNLRCSPIGLVPKEVPG
jgi:hypothetical protein